MAGLTISLSPRNPVAARRLLLMEALMGLDEITMESIPAASVADARWAWDHGLLEIVGSSPLTYVVTLAGERAVRRGREQREEMLLAESGVT